MIRTIKSFSGNGSFSLGPFPSGSLLRRVIVNPNLATSFFLAVGVSRGGDSDATSFFHEDGVSPFINQVANGSSRENTICLGHRFTSDAPYVFFDVSGMAGGVSFLSVDVVVSSPGTKSKFSPKGVISDVVSHG